MLKIIDTETVEDPNIFGEILREAYFIDYMSLSEMRLKSGFNEFFGPGTEDTDPASLILSSFGYTQIPDMSIYRGDEYEEFWKNRESRNIVVLSKTRMYFAPPDLYAAWFWDGSGSGSMVLGEKNRFVLNTDMRLDNNWQWIK